MLLSLAALAGCARQPSEAPPQPTDEASPWAPAETNPAGTPASWKWTRSAEGFSQFQVVAANTGQTFNLLLSGDLYGPDIAIGTRLRADAGEEDRGGGVLWRARDAANYYVARWNPLEDNVRAYVVQDGVRRQIASATVKLDPTAWHDFEARMIDTRITVSIDLVERLAVDDTTFAAAGQVGLWTKADACTTFTQPMISRPVSPNR